MRTQAGARNGSRYSPAPKIGRQTKYELAFSDEGPVHSGFDFKLKQQLGRADFFRSQLYLFPGPDRMQKFHRSDGGKKKDWTLCLGISGRRCDSRCLSQRFRNDHARHNRIAGKMTCKHRVSRVENRPGLHRFARIARHDLPDKNKGRPMRQAQEVTCDVRQVTGFYGNGSRFFPRHTSHVARLFLHPFTK